MSDNTKTKGCVIGLFEPGIKFSELTGMYPSFFEEKTKPKKIYT